MFVGWGLRVRNYFIDFSFFVQCYLHVGKPYLGDPPARTLMEERVAWMLDWQAVWAVPFFIRRASVQGVWCKSK